MGEKNDLLSAVASDDVDCVEHLVEYLSCRVFGQAMYRHVTFIVVEIILRISHALWLSIRNWPVSRLDFFWVFLKLAHGPYPRRTPLGQGIASFDVQSLRREDFCPMTVESGPKDRRFDIPSANHL